MTTANWIAQTLKTNCFLLIIKTGPVKYNVPVQRLLKHKGKK